MRRVPEAGRSEEAFREEFISQVFLAIMPLRLMFLIEDPHKRMEVEDSFVFSGFYFRKPVCEEFLRCAF